MTKDSVQRTNANLIYMDSNLKEGANSGPDFWSRPSLPPIDPEKDDIVFQQIEVENGDQCEGTWLRMFGITEAGHSVLVNVTDFLPYFYIGCPRGFGMEDVEPFKTELNNRIGFMVVRQVEIVSRRSLWGYTVRDKLQP